MRVKRGIQNTEIPGGFYKDKVYLIGAVEILQNRNNIDFVELYCGKIDVKDLVRINQNKIPNLILNKENIKLPLFMHD